MNQKYFGFGKIFGMNSNELKMNVSQSSKNLAHEPVSPSSILARKQNFVSHKRPASITTLSNKTQRVRRFK